jgi:hypothetical protein
MKSLSSEARTLAPVNVRDTALLPAWLHNLRRALAPLLSMDTMVSRAGSGSPHSELPQPCVLAFSDIGQACAWGVSAAGNVRIHP